MLNNKNKRNISIRHKNDSPIATKLLFALNVSSCWMASWNDCPLPRVEGELHWKER